jgi:transcriptional regulator with XRE-family HTH domain
METARLAENVRRASGAHLVSLDALATYVGLTRPGLMKLVASGASSRTRPKTETAIRLAEAFALDVRDLVDDPASCLRRVAENFERAPIRAIAKVPEPWWPGEEAVHERRPAVADLKTRRKK